MVVEAGETPHDGTNTSQLPIRTKTVDAPSSSSQTLTGKQEHCEHPPFTCPLSRSID
jgi:hypothetical protein